MAQKTVASATHGITQCKNDSVKINFEAKRLFFIFYELVDKNIVMSRPTALANNFTINQKLLEHMTKIVRIDAKCLIP